MPPDSWRKSNHVAVNVSDVQNQNNNSFERVLEQTGSKTHIRQKLVEIYLAASIIFGAISILAIYVTLEYQQKGGSLSNLWLCCANDIAFGVTHPALTSPVIGIHSFSDLLLNITWATSHSPYIAQELFPPSNYPPFAHVFMLPFTLIPYTYAFAIFAILSIGMIVAPIGLALRGLSRPILISVLISGFVFTYPMLMIIDRGNIQGITTGFCLIGLWFFMGNKYKAAAALIGIAAALKIYPILLMLLFLKRRRYGEFFIGCAVAAVLTLGALATFEGGIKANVIGFVGGLSSFTGGSLNPDLLIPRNHSFSSLLSYLSTKNIFPLNEIVENLLANLGPYYLVIFSCLILLSVTKHKYNENQTLLLICLAMISIPFVTYGYALSVLFLVLIHLFDFRYKREQTSLAYQVALVTLIAFLFMAKGLPVGSVFQLTIRTFLDPIVLLVLTVLSVINVSRPTR